jgi:arylsulfatase A-like enzyme
MPTRPNILFLMTDQMQGRVLEPDHPCQTPTFDRLAAEGTRIRNAYTPNAVCSPARASLMTGLLPHNHGVLEVIHCVDEDQCNLRTEHPHWAQWLVDAGYRTGYFGKWHVERSDDGGSASEHFRAHRNRVRDGIGAPSFSLEKHYEGSEGYRNDLFYGVTEEPASVRGMGTTADLALEFLEEAGESPWCCFVSITEPHDPFLCGREAFDRYDVDNLDLAPNVHDEMSDRPGLYRKAGKVWEKFGDREHREAAACYYASITEIDEQYGRLLSWLDESGQAENTIVVLTSDHGELLGSHGMYCKNLSGFEEVYGIPMVVRGPGVEAGVTSDARVGLHDVGPTLMELVGLDGFEPPDARSFAPLLRGDSGDGDYQTGFAEYHGGRYRLTQRVFWDGPWKLVHNGFDFDELYNLDDDPWEMRNLAPDPTHRPRLKQMFEQMWDRVRASGDHALLNSHYPILRLATFGPSADQ